jgi:hypothetical protein
MPTQAASFNLTNMNTAAGATQYKSQIDSDLSVLARIGDIFSPHQGTAATPPMKVYLDPGFILAGTSLTEIGTHTTATFTSGATTATVANPAGISGTMWISDNISNTYIAPGTTCTISGSTLTLSIATLQAGTNIQVTIGQISTTITAPVGNPRIDRVVVSASSGAVSIITGTPAGSPTPPALTAGALPVAQVLLQTSSTSILNSMITDERAFAGSAVNNTEATVASASTTDLGATNVNAVLITGTTTITSLGGNGALTSPYYDMRFSGALILTYNATSLTLPGKNNITTIAGDRARFQYMGSGNWQCVQYIRASGTTITEGVAATIASASTTDLGTAGVSILTVSGTTTITSFGSTATLDNPIYFLTFSGAMTLTYNATSLIIPGKANLTTAANDSATAQYLGSGNWQILSYSPVAGVAGNTVGYNVQTSTYAPTSTDKAKIITFVGAGANATWTMASASTLGSGWWAYLLNPTQYNLTITTSGGNIDGLSSYVMYPGEERLIQCDGTNFHTLIQKGFYFSTTTNTSFTTPPGYQVFDTQIWGGGGGGGGLAGGNVNAGGGGGGAYNARMITAASMGSSQTITIGGGGATGVAANATASTGGTTSIGSLLYAYGGAGGWGSTTTYGPGGGGGGQTSAGVTITGATFDSNGGGPNGVNLTGGNATSTPFDGMMGGGAGTINSIGGSSIWGGGGGSGANNATSNFHGGNSIYGGGGGAIYSSAAPIGGISSYGGNGGASGSNGVIPGGGGGGGNGVGASGQAIIRGTT